MFVPHTTYSICSPSELLNAINRDTYSICSPSELLNAINRDTKLLKNNT